MSDEPISPAASVSTAAPPPAGLSRDAGGVHLPLAASLDMTAALPLARSLTDLRGEALTLDASAVRRLGGQCLQVLLAAEQAWSTDGLAFMVADPSPEFTDALDFMGASALIPVSFQEPTA